MANKKENFPSNRPSSKGKNNFKKNPKWGSLGIFTKPGIWIFFISFLLYINTLSLDYALDDSMLITSNSITQKGIAGIHEIWSSDLFLGYFGKSGVETGGRYRPVSQTIFALEVQFFGNNPAAGHFFNILFYSLTCLLLFMFLKKLFPFRHGVNEFLSLPFIASLFYCVHPLHVEAVANIKSLDEIMAMLFSLLTTYLIILWQEKKSPGYGSD